MNNIFLILKNELVAIWIAPIICGIVVVIVTNDMQNRKTGVRILPDNLKDANPGVDRKPFISRKRTCALIMGILVFFVVQIFSKSFMSSSDPTPEADPIPKESEWVDDGVRYVGIQIDGKIDGDGEAVYKNGEVYKGEFKKGLRDGSGKLYSSSGEILYDGNWKDNVKEGSGSEYCGALGGRYEGEYRAGEREGDGIFYFKDGSRYEGKWESGVRNGMGVFIGADGTASAQVWLQDEFVTNYLRDADTWIDTDGNVYTGKKKDGEIEGYGRIAYSDGSIYLGELSGGVKEGEGIYYYEGGSRYEGEWKDGKREGTGVLCFEKDGGIYYGEFSDDTMNGTGSYYVPSGFRYEGEWKDGNYCGEGTAWYFPYDELNRWYFEGEWMEDCKNGTMYYRDGTCETGIFQNGELVEVTGEMRGIRSQPDVAEWTGQDGNQYVGRQQDGLIEGKGIRIENQYDELYIGEFVNGIPNGNGTEYYNDGDYYTGTFIDGERNGTGVYHYSDGGKVKTWYCGEWVDGSRNGNCVIQCFDDLTYYMGEWVNGKRYGMGSMHSPEGVYYGEWQNGVRSGTGVFHDTDGSCYFGGYQEDQKSGYGVMYYIDGSRYEGEWSYNMRNGIGTEFTAEGDKKYGTWLNGMYQN